MVFQIDDDNVASGQNRSESIDLSEILEVHDVSSIWQFERWLGRCFERGYRLRIAGKEVNVIDDFSTISMVMHYQHGVGRQRQQ